MIEIWSLGKLIRAKVCATECPWQIMFNSLLQAEIPPWSALMSSCVCFLAVCFLSVSLGALLKCLMLPFLHHRHLTVLCDGGGPECFL